MTFGQMTYTIEMGTSKYIGCNLINIYMYTCNLLVTNKVYRTLLFDESNLVSNWSDEGSGNYKLHLK